MLLVQPKHPFIYLHSTASDATQYIGKSHSQPKIHYFKGDTDLTECLPTYSFVFLTENFFEGKRAIVPWDNLWIRLYASPHSDSSARCNGDGGFYFSNFYFGGGYRVPRRRGRQSMGAGAPTYKFAGFSQKLHEIKKILVRRGAPTLDPPMYIRRFHLLTQFFFSIFTFFVSDDAN